jgi:hypothetical protein
MADRGEALLGGRRRSFAGQLLDVAGDVHGLHGRDREHAGGLTPGQKLADRLRAGAAVADVGRKEFDGALLRAPAAAAAAKRAGEVSAERKGRS